MKPFDLEAAKRGEPIVNSNGRPLHYIGVDTTNTIVLEDSLNGWIYRAEAECVFMAPKKRTVWVNMHPDCEVASWYATKALADMWGIEPRIGNKAYPVEIEE